MAESVGIHSPQYIKAPVGSLPESIAKPLKYALGGDTMDLVTRLIISGAVLLLTIAILSNVYGRLKKQAGKNLPPTIPGGVPFLGNLLQLKSAKPHRTFTDWAAKFGPIYHIKTGSINNVVINSAELAKEAMVTRYSSISTRRMPTALTILTAKKTMVAMSDYGPLHQKLKKMVVGNLLGPSIQARNRPIREDALRLMIDEIFAALKGKEFDVINVRDFIKHSLFLFTMKQVFGHAPEGVHVPELGGRYVEKWEIFDALIIDPLQSVMYVDWRNFFPFLSFIPNKSVENAISEVDAKRNYIVDALIAEQRKLIANQGPTRCYCDILLTEAKDLTPVQLRMSVWEPIIESADTTLVSIEWAIYEIARNPQIQERLYKEVQSVVGHRMVTEDDINKLPLVTAVIQETLRVYCPVSLIPPRYVHEDTTIGGYDIPKGWDVLINQYGINLDPKVWSNPQTWDPDRLLNDKSIDLGLKDFRIMPFGAGKRMCAGITQAMLLIHMHLASLVLHFNWRLPPAANPTEEKMAEDTSYLTTHKLHPLQAIAEPRVGSRIKYEGEMN
jgi:ent-kaurene oxidase